MDGSLNGGFENVRSPLVSVASVSQVSRTVTRAKCVHPRKKHDGYEGLVRIGCFMGGVMDDVGRRFSQYGSDITDAFTMKTVSSSLFMFFATGSSTIALARVANSETEGHIGLNEYLMINSVAGMAHALFGCQPLLVLRPTGPITAFVGLLYTLSKSIGADFFPFLAWTGIWVGIFMIFVAGFELSRHIGMLTRFSHEIFAFFVCTIYIHDGISGLIDRVHVPEYGDALFAFILFSLTFGIAVWLGDMYKSKMFSETIRKYLMDYNLTIGIFVAIGVSYIWKSTIAVERITMTPHFGPTYKFDPTTGEYDPRPWIPDFFAQKWLPGAGFVAAIPITLFFFMDQNVSSLLCQTPDRKLSKGSYFHTSFGWMGIFNIAFPIFGTPFVTGSLPHSPQFVEALTEWDRKKRPIKVYENRIAPFLMYMMIGLPLFGGFKNLVEAIPEAVIDGTLTYVGFAGIFGLQLWKRLFMLVTNPKDFPRDVYYTKVKPYKMHLFTIIQVTYLIVSWALNLSPAGLAFPLIICSMVPFSKYIMPRWFTPEELKMLDCEKEMWEKKSRKGRATISTAYSFVDYHSVVEDDGPDDFPVAIAPPPSQGME